MNIKHYAKLLVMAALSMAAVVFLVNRFAPESVKGFFRVA